MGPPVPGSFFHQEERARPQDGGSKWVTASPPGPSRDFVGRADPGFSEICLCSISLAAAASRWAAVVKSWGHWAPVTSRFSTAAVSSQVASKGCC